jgi:gliding motility-associated-like protein
MLITRSLLKPKGLFVQFLFLIFPGFIYAQTFSPITVTGFNHDVVAEAGTSSLTTTSISIDGPTVSNKVMYTSTFRTLNAFGGGGLPDNGTIVNATAGTYQMAAYTGNNALLLQRTQSGDLTLATPSKYTRIRLLALSTEGSSRINATLTFSDGSTTNALTNYTLGDWFNGTANLVLSGMGRCTRATPASGADAYPTNPRLYYAEIALSCTDRQKTLQKITLTNVTTAGNNAPFPNAVFFAMSGISYTQTISAAITDVTCTNAGSATLTVTGSASPYTIVWNTNPVQTGVTANNLGVGTFQATITDASACATVYPVVMVAPAAPTLSLHADTTICSGASFNANTVSNATSFAWSPTTGVNNPAIANPILAPTATTLYTVTASTGSCITTKSFTTTVNTAATLTVHADTTVCAPTSFSANTVSNGTSFSWSPTSGVSNPTIANPVLSPTFNTQYTVTASASGCSASKSFNVIVNPGVTVSAGANIIIFQGQSIQLPASGSQGTYLWTPATALSAANVLNPVASPTVTTTYTIKVTSPQGCTASSSVVVSVISDCVKPMQAFTPNGDGFNDKWFVTNGNCVTKVTARVYNRWGSKVFESLDYKNDWDGAYKGKPLPDGTYYFVVHYDLVNNSAVDKKGSVTILR